MIDNQEKIIESLIKRGVTDINIRREENVYKKWEEQLWCVYATHNFRRQFCQDSLLTTANLHFRWYKTNIVGYGKDINEAFLDLISCLDKMDSYTPESADLKPLYEDK